MSVNKKTLKSVGAVIAGLLTVAILSVLTDAILEGIGFFPPATEGLYDNNLLLIALLYRTVYAFMGGFVTAKLAPEKPMKLVLILLLIGTIMGILGVIAGWNLSERWYPISLVITSAAALYIGGRLGSKGKK